MFDLIVLFFIVFWSFNIYYENDKISYNLEYNGVLWVMLDKYNTWRYGKNDDPVEWIKFEKNEI